MPTTKTCVLNTHTTKHKFSPKNHFLIPENDKETKGSYYTGYEIGIVCDQRANNLFDSLFVVRHFVISELGNI